MLRRGISGMKVLRNNNKSDIQIMNNEPLPAIWNPDKALEGVFCPTCGCWMDDYYGQPDKCPKCGQVLEGWTDMRVIKI